MKRFTWIFASSVGLVGLASLATAPVGCVSSNSGAPDDDAGPLPGEDSGLPGTDATVPSGDSGSDAGPVDSGPDTADAAPAPLTVTVLLGGAPESGVVVVFQDATGAVVSTATTDATGTVSQLVVAGSQLTAVLGTPASPSLVTVKSVDPGDAITLVDDQQSLNSLDEYVLPTVPSPPWDASATTENVNAGNCGNSAGYSFDITSSCASGGQFPLLARAQDESGNELGYTYQTGNAVVPDAGLPEDGGPLLVDIARPWATSSVTQTIFASAPGAPDIGFNYLEVADGVSVTGYGGGYNVVDGGYTSAAYVVHSGYPDFVQVGASAGGNVDSITSVVGGVTRSAPAATSQTTSFDLATLPTITASAVDSTDAGTLVQPVTSWTSGSLASANGIVVATYWSGELPDGGGIVDGSWTIVTPSTATTVQAPAMPPSAAAYLPFTGANYGPVPQVAAIEAPFFPGYAGLKSQFGSLLVFRGSNVAPLLPTLPVNGTLYASVIYRQLD